jgi:hypothetical protein
MPAFEIKKADIAQHAEVFRILGVGSVAHPTKEDEIVSPYYGS